MSGKEKKGEESRRVQLKPCPSFSEGGAGREAPMAETAGLHTDHTVRSSRNRALRPRGKTV